MYLSELSIVVDLIEPEKIFFALDCWRLLLCGNNDGFNCLPHWHAEWCNVKKIFGMISLQQRFLPNYGEK